MRVQSQQKRKDEIANTREEAKGEEGNQASEKVEIKTRQGRKDRDKASKEDNRRETSCPSITTTNIYSRGGGSRTRRTQSPVPPPIRKVLEKKSKAQLSTNIAHYYPFISAKALIAFDKRIKGKQPIKERALDLKSYGTDKVIHDIIKSLGWT